MARRNGNDHRSFANLEPADPVHDGDFSHVRPSGRTLWQRRLAEELARLHETGVIEDGAAGQGEEQAW